MTKQVIELAKTVAESIIFPRIKTQLTSLSIIRLIKYTKKQTSFKVKSARLVISGARGVTKPSVIDIVEVKTSNMNIE